MKNFLHFIMLVLLLASIECICAQTVIQTSFESSDLPAYDAGSINGQNDWTIESGTATILSGADYIYSGVQGVQFYSTGTSEFQTDYVPYSDEETGLSDLVYVDMWLKINTALSDEAFYIGGYDLTPDGSSKRTFFLQFDPIASGSTGDIQIYSSWEKNEQSDALALGSWLRLSICADYSAQTYEVAMNGSVVDGSFSFREAYDPADKGRSSGLYEFHSLRFYHEGGTFDVALDDVYIGTNEISDVSFTEPSSTRTVSVTQPEHGTISLSPDQDEYELGTEVTASIVVDDHYVFSAWTGSYSSSDNPLTFTVDANIALGASVEVDENNPPASYTITVTQPSEGGTITVNPDQSTYYEGTEVTFTASGSIGYDFIGWTDDLSGIELTKTITISSDMIVSASFEAGVYDGREIIVTDCDELSDALADMLPGDNIIVADGTYDCSSFSITSLGGTTSQPVVIQSQNQGGSTFTGDVAFTFNQCSNITIRDFNFEVEVYTMFKLVGSDHIRICYNTLKNTGDEGSKWIIIGDVWENETNTSSYNRVDHNLFDGKDDSGAWVVIDGNHGGEDEDKICSQYDQIDHNHFKNNGPRADNEKETIRIGMSDISMSSAYCTVENNLFEACNGDPEIISVKSCDNIVQNNTFVECLGTLSLRHGNRNIVRGNYFFGNGVTGTDTDGDEIGCGGVRVYGKDHKIYNNYFEGLTGSVWDAACTITNGDKANPDEVDYTGLTSHFVPENIEFTYNTLVNNASDIEIGYDNNGNYSSKPVNCLIANNIIVQNANPVSTVYSTSSLDGVSFADNIIYTYQSGSWGDISFTSDEALNIDPLLVQTDCRAYDDACDYLVPVETYKLSSSSPAIDATVSNTFSYVDTDIEGQLIINTRDKGADEYNATDVITNGAVDESYVGIDAINFAEIESSATSITAVNADERDVYAYPNPFSENTEIIAEGSSVVNVFNSQGQLVDSFTMVDSYSWSSPCKGLFICVVNTDGRISNFKIVSE